ncbi:MAG: XcyI family restriction endonuclease, partial [Dehalococcoidia bacterium]
ALGQTEPNVVKEQLSTSAPSDAQQILAASGVRDEYVFPTPIILDTTPTLVGYHRLLLGLPQKTFYGSGIGMGTFKSMETRGTLNARQKTALSWFCRVIGESLADRVRQLSPAVTARDIAELPLLTLGAQFQGAINNAIGKLATIDVFLAIGEIVKGYVTKHDERHLTVVNASGRTVVIALASDPDVSIQEDFRGTLHNKVAIEIKGGTDKSNARNREGEAEKSHQKAKGAGFRDFWTIIAKKGLDLAKLRAESPTTTSWFNAAQVLGREGEDWEDLRSRLAGEVGIPVT